MYKLERYLVAPIFLIFIYHGWLYYLFPDAHYLTDIQHSNQIQFIKYACVIFTLPLLLRLRFSKQDFIWASAGVSLCVAALLPNLYWVRGFNFSLFQFQVAMIGYFYAPFLLRYFSDSRRTLRFLVVGLVLIVAGSFYEFFSGGLFVDYTRSGFRSAGPFINPNNTGIMTAVLATAAHFMTRNSGPTLLIMALALLALVLSASKTGIMIYAFGLVFSLQIRLKLVVAIALVSTALVDPLSMLASSDGLRVLSLESGGIRLARFQDVFGTFGADNSLSILFGVSPISNVDNAFLDVLMFGGLYTLTLVVLSAGLLIYLLVRQKQWVLLVIATQLLLAMMTTNVLRLWPVGYAYWSFVGIAVGLAYRDSMAHAKELRSPGRRLSHVY